MLTRQQRRQQERMAQRNQSSTIESHIYAICLVHDDNYSGRSPLGVDKFIEITRHVSELTNVHIKHCLSEGMATVFFRMHESNDGSSMTLDVARRGDINTQGSALNPQIVCNIMSLDQWVEGVTDKIYDSEGIRIGTEMAESVECPIHARDAHIFLSQLVSHIQMELNNIRELSRQGRATRDTPMPYRMIFTFTPKEGDSAENCSMSDIANKIDSLISEQWQ